MNELMRYLLGFLEVELRGKNLSSFLRRASAEQVRLRHVRYDGSRLRARVELDDLPLLRRPLRQSRSQLRIRSRVGLPFWWSGARRRPMLLLGLFLLIVLYGVAGTRIFVVEVQGGGKAAAQVLQVAAAQGVRPLWPLAAVHEKALAKAILRQVPGLSYAGVRIDGTEVVIRVDRNLKRPAAPNIGVPQPLAARTAGLVTRVVVFHGSAVVSPGTTVVRGQLLILPAAGESGKVLASGHVFARVWRVVYVRQPLQRTIYLATDQRGTMRSIRFDGRAILSLPARPPFAHYHVRQERWRIPYIPVEVVANRYVRLRPLVLKLSEKQAVALAVRRATAQAKRSLNSAAKILKVLPQVTNVKGSVHVRVTVEAEEDIANGS